MLPSQTSFLALPVAYAFKMSVLTTSSPTKSLSNKRLSTAKDIAPGEEIFSTDSILLASKEGWGCIACNSSTCMGYCDPFRFYFMDLRPVLQAVPKIAAETNVADTILRLIIKYIALRKGENAKLRELLDKVFELSTRDSLPEKRDSLVADRLYALLPKLHQGFVSKDKIQQLCRIFTTNTVYVPHINGIGLFPIVVLVDHSCKENCFYECVGEKIVVTSIGPVGKDQPLTLNFATSYMPRAYRQAEIRALLGYDCACDMCNLNVRDETRAFICKKCTFTNEEDCGLVAPKGNGDRITDWSCSRCNEVPSKETHAEYLKLEDQTRDADPVSLKVNDLLKGRVMHPYHYVIYKALEQRVNLLTNIRPENCEKFILWLLGANVRVLPPNHPSRADLYDTLGQVRRLNGDGKGCKEAFLEAAGIRDRICSKSSPILSLAKQKASNPEKTEINFWYPLKDI